MVEVFLIAFALLYPCFEGLRDPLVFPVRVEVNNLWHRLGFTIRALVGIILGIALDAVLLVPAYAFYFWIVFNLFTGEGKTAVSDKWGISIWFKVAGLIICIVAYWFYKFF